MYSLLFLSSLFFLAGLLIIITKPNLLFILIALEIILLGINVNFILGSLLHDDFLGQFLSLILFAIAALDTSVGLVILLAYYNLHVVSILTANIKG
jgi:NADH-quinone oxidoreductase subunit K